MQAIMSCDEVLACTTSSLVRIKVTIRGIYGSSACIFRRVWSMVSEIAFETECEH